MSGGVDSSVAAQLLKDQGHDVIGVFLRLGQGAPRPSHGSSRACCSVEDARDAGLVAARLGIPFYALDASRDFSRIIDHFVEEYHRARTPNPCALCNQWIKFGTLREKALALGCDAVATGHYARIERDSAGRPQLLRGLDRSKDQSYFLFLMPAESLGQTLFPVGGMTKAEIRAIARERGLPVAEKAESQEICFVPNDDYREVLRARTPERMRPGRFVDLSGRVLGTHAGYQGFTLGQRRGVGVALGRPAYVTAIDPCENSVTLGEREELLRSRIAVADVQWLSVGSPLPGKTLRAAVQIRHRHSPRPATLLVGEGDRVDVHLDEPELAVTPGQAAVFYSGDVVLGGGWIESASRGPEGP